MGLTAPSLSHQRVDSKNITAFQDFANVAIGLFAAAAGLPEASTLGAVNAAAYWESNFASKWIPDVIYGNLRVQNVYDIKLGYSLYLSGQIGPTPSQ